MNDIKDWISNSYETNKKLSLKSCLFVSGYSGIGKTYNINKISNELKLFIVNLNSYNCCSSAQLTDILFKSFVSSLIQTLTNNTDKKIIIIDDFDILMALDNTINIALYNFLINNTNLKHIPIICIINNETIKKLGEIKKKCLIMQHPILNDNEFHLILQSYKHDIIFNETLKIIKLINYNLNDAIRIITNTYYNSNDENIITDDLYSNNFNRNKIKKIILKEQWIIPLKFHENLIIELNNRKGLKKNKDIFYKNFIINFCYFDLFMHKNNDIGIDIFISMIYELFNMPVKKAKDHNLNNFTKILSYLSLQKKNNKSIYNKSSFPYNQIGNYHLNLINRKFIY
jgi:hypothetical protein